MLIQILTPIGYNHAPEFWISLLNFQQYCVENDIKIAFRHNRMSNIYFAREKLLQSALKEIPDYDYILWIDADASFTPMDIEKLIAADKDVIGGKAIFHDKKTGTFVYNFGNYYPDSWKTLKMIMANPRATEKLPDEPFEVDYTGCHFLLIKKGVCEKIKGTVFEPLKWSVISEKLKDVKGFMSEDGAFCHKLKEAGYKILIDPDTFVGHIKEMNFNILKLK